MVRCTLNIYKSIHVSLVTTFLRLRYLRRLSGSEKASLSCVILSSNAHTSGTAPVCQGAPAAGSSLGKRLGATVATQMMEEDDREGVGIDGKRIQTAQRSARQLQQ